MHWLILTPIITIEHHQLCHAQKNFKMLNHAKRGKVWCMRLLAALLLKIRRVYDFVKKSPPAHEADRLRIYADDHGYIKTKEKRKMTKTIHCKLGARKC